jgi:hypothetical protein
MLIMAALFTSFPPERPVGIGVLVAATALAAWWAPVLAGCAVGALAWVFYLGFVVHTNATLGTPSDSDALALAVLLATGVLAAGARHLLRSVRRGRGSDPMTAILATRSPATLIVVVLDADSDPTSTSPIATAPGTWAPPALPPAKPSTATT